MRNEKVYIYVLALTALVAFAAGCQKQDPASLVNRRASERWNLLVSHEPVKAYEYLSPGYRTTHTLDQYVAFVATSLVRWKSAVVDGQKCDTESCTVNLTVKSVIPGQIVHAPHDVDHEAPVVEHWILSGGEWFFLPDSRLEPIPVQKDQAEQAHPRPIGDTVPSPGVPPLPPSH